MLAVETGWQRCR